MGIFRRTHMRCRQSRRPAMSGTEVSATEYGSPCCRLLGDSKIEARLFKAKSKLPKHLEHLGLLQKPRL